MKKRGTIDFIPTLGEKESPLEKLVEKIILISMLQGVKASLPSTKSMQFVDFSDIPFFDEAIEELKKKIPLNMETVAELTEQAKKRAFYVSRLSELEAIEKVQKLLIKNVAENTGLSTFIQDLKEAQLLDAIGWGANSGYYWETVYRTNTISAFNAGRAKAIEEMKPEYLEFVGIEDSRQSSICASCSGIVLPANAPFWRTHYPPLHFNCRSTIRPVFKEEIDEGITTPSKGSPIVYTAKGFGKYPLGDDGSWDEVTDSLLRRYNVFMFNQKISKNNFKVKEFWTQPLLQKYEEEYLKIKEERKSPLFSLLSNKEASVITFYTSAENNMVINDYIRLREEKRIRLNPFMERVVRELNHALKKLPPYSGVSYRGQGGWKGFGELKKGREFTAKAFLSTAMENPYRGEFQLLINGASGRSIQDLSIKPEENEILFPKDARFRIIKVDRFQEMFIIEVDEVR